MSQGVVAALCSVLGVGLLTPLMMVVQEAVKARGTRRASQVQADASVSNQGKQLSQAAQEAFYARLIADNQRLAGEHAQLTSALTACQRQRDEFEREATYLRGRLDEVVDQLTAMKAAKQIVDAQRRREQRERGD